MRRMFRILFLLPLVLISGLSASATPPNQAVDHTVLIGTWDVELIEMGFAMEFVFKMEDESLAGEMIFEMGSAAMENIKYEEGKLSFYIEFDAGGQIMGVDVAGTVEEDKITGFMNSDMGSAEFTGTKRKEN